MKLYCDCFLRGELCTADCFCRDCHNDDEAHDDERRAAIKSVLAKNPGAFQPRIAAVAGGCARDLAVVLTLFLACRVSSFPSSVVPACALGVPEHSFGCRCKKSMCLLKYCECFQAGVVCGRSCKVRFRSVCWCVAVCVLVARARSPFFFCCFPAHPLARLFASATRLRAQCAQCENYDGSVALMQQREAGPVRRHRSRELRSNEIVTSMAGLRTTVAEV